MQLDGDHQPNQISKQVADVMLGMMGVPVLYSATNPYSWMQMLGLGGKTNFFEGRVTEYKRADVSGDIFEMDTDFRLPRTRSPSSGTPPRCSRCPGGTARRRHAPCHHRTPHDIVMNDHDRSDLLNRWT